MRVVASFYPLAFAAEQVGGEAVSVIDLTPPGVEPHDLELGAEDLEAIADADVVVLLGGGFQPAVEDAVAAEATGAVIDVMDGLGPPRMDGPDGSVDPHVWLEPDLYGGVVAGIASALQDAGVDTSVGAPAFAAQLADLAVAFDRGLAPCQGKLLVTTHAAFGYLAAAHGLRQEAIAGLSPESEPDPARLAALIALIREEGVRTVFTEALASPDVAQTLAAEAGAAFAVLDPLEGLAQDRIDAGEDYLSVMRDNLAVLQEGLGC